MAVGGFIFGDGGVRWEQRRIDEVLQSIHDLYFYKKNVRGSIDDPLESFYLIL